MKSRARSIGEVKDNKEKWKAAICNGAESSLEAVKILTHNIKGNKKEIQL